MPSPASNASASEPSGEPADPHASSVSDSSLAAYTPDQMLLAEIAGGKEDALCQLYAAYRPRLWRYVAQRVSGDSELTNSVLQDVFLSVWHTAGTYRGEASVATWLFCIARNVASSARRSRFGAENHRQVLTARDSGDEVELDAWSDRQLLEQAIVDRLSVHEAFANLSPKYREVVELVFGYGFTYEETGRILNIPIGTVKSRLNAARQLLSRILAGPDGKAP